MTSSIDTAGGVCTLQNIRAFDTRQGLLPLPHAMPQMPVMPSTQIGLNRSRGSRRNSWNPVVRAREEKDRRNASRMQALVGSTDRDSSLMSCTLVRRYSEFEIESATDELETISLVDGRKVRWLAVYAILQSLISVNQAPKQVRNTEGLSYALCCEAPTRMPWHTEKIARPRRPPVRTSSIEPDTQHSHTNMAPPSPASLSRTISRSSTVSKTEPVKRSTSRDSTIRDRRQTIAGETPSRTTSLKSASGRSHSLRRLVAYKSTESVAEELPARPKAANRTSFCEIYVPGYGNGLNAVEVQKNTKAGAQANRELKSMSTTTMSRECSNASTNSSWSKTSSPEDSDVSTPDASPVMLSDSMSKLSLAGPVHVVDDTDGLETVHFNSSTWDATLNVLERRRFNITT